MISRKMMLPLPMLTIILPCLSLLIACTSPTQPKHVPVFNGQRAFADAQKQLAFGFRYPGAKGYLPTMEYIEKTFAEAGLAASRQAFTAKVEGQELSFANLIAESRQPGDGRLLFAAHWDSRPRADKDASEMLRSRPIPGANDGASGVAVLLEIARHLGAQPPSQNKVDIVLFDAEDYGSSPATMFLGSQHFAAQVSQAKYRCAILIDMVGDRLLEIFEEENSRRYAPTLNRAVFDLAAELKLSAFVAEERHSVLDDHLPLNKIGIPTIDLIDFDYPAWHTTEDDLDKISAESLATVGTLLLHFAYRKSCP